MNSCVLWHRLCVAVPTPAHSCIAVSEHWRCVGGCCKCKGMLMPLKSAFMSMFIQEPLSKERPVLACVCSVLLLLVEVPCAVAGNVEMGMWKWDVPG